MDNKKSMMKKQRIMVYSYWWRYWIAWFDSINFAFGKTGKCNNRLSRHREEIESLRQLLNERRFEPNVTGTKRTNYSASSSIPNNEISDLSRKIQHLENELSKIQKTTLVHGTPTPSTITPPIKPTRIGYFGTAISR